MTVEKQREKLASWLREWNIEKKLDDGETDAPAELAATAPPATGACIAPKPGDVILLPPTGMTTFSRPVYLMLVRKQWNGMWHAVPFSRFTVPATDGELATGREFMPLKVLSLWNHNSIHEKLVVRSWLVASMADADVKLADDYISGLRHRLPDSRTGAPIMRSFDPRQEYLDEERAIWFDMPRAVTACDTRFREDADELLDAAEDGDDYGPKPRQD